MGMLRGVVIGRTGGGGWKGEAFNLAELAGEPGRPGTLGEQEAPPRRKTSGKQKGAQLLGGIKPLGHRSEAGDGFGGKCGSGGYRGDPGSITREEEGSGRGSPRVLRAERGPQGAVGLGSRREGSQTLGAELPEVRATTWGRFFGRGSEKKGPWFRKR